MSRDERASLAEARIVDRGGDSGLLRGLTVAVAVGVVAAVALRSRVAAIIVAIVAVVLGGLRLFHHVLERDAAQEHQLDAMLPAGEREYAYRPRALVAVVLVGSLLVCALVIVSPGLDWLSLVAAVVAAGCVFAFALATLLRQRILVTDSHVTVPRSRWSREEVSIPLSDIQVRVWGGSVNPNVEIASFGEERDFGMSFLGEANFRELVRLLEQRSAAARALLTAQPSLDDPADGGGA